MYNSSYLPFWKGDPHKDTFNSVELFFGINEQMFNHIFSPGSELTSLYGGKKLTLTSSHPEVAYNIIQLINSVESYKCFSKFNIIKTNKNEN